MVIYEDKKLAVEKRDQNIFNGGLDDNKKRKNTNQFFALVKNGVELNDDEIEEEKDVNQCEGTIVGQRYPVSLYDGHLVKQKERQLLQFSEFNG